MIQSTKTDVAYPEHPPELDPYVTGPAGPPAFERRSAGTREFHLEWLAAFPSAITMFVVGSWWMNRPTGGAGDFLTAIGQLTGFGAALAALATVVLMARMPIITNGLGTDRSVRWHRITAIVTMVLLPVHVVASIAGYAATDRVDILHEINVLVTTYADMVTATVATVLFAIVFATSVRRVRAWFAYHTWLFVHFYSYLAVALAFGHELSDGASFAHASFPTLVWTWLHLFVAGIVGWYRVALPAAHMWRHRLVVSRRRAEGDSAVSLTLSGRDLDAYEPRAGQYLRVRFLTKDGWWQSHPFSFSAVPTATNWRITIADAGDHTHDLQRIERGTRALVSGVYGEVTPDARVTDKVALIGGGIGITPLRAILEGLPSNVDTAVVYRAHSNADVIMRRELDDLASARGATIQYVLGRRSANPANDALSPAGLRQLIPDLVSRDVYVSGHAAFVDFVCASLKRLDVPSERIHAERFDT